MLPNMTNILHVIRLDYMSCILTVLIGKNLDQPRYSPWYTCKTLPALTPPYMTIKLT